ncbi:MAG: GHKL domain-containing protein [Lachnospiraceae bacterium]|nr:GHKL domain-containing protein [Lachnospiraceae bacterium]
MKEYSVWEFLIYNILRSASIIFMAYPFMRDSGRFSRRVTASLFVLMEVLWVAIAQIGQMPFFQTMGFAMKIELAQTVMLIAILFVALKERPGKVLFVFFVLYTLGSFISLVAKFIEIQWDRDMAWNGYRWTASVTILITIVVILIPATIFIHKDFRAVMGKEGDDSLWRYLWFIPFAFYLFWMQSFYSSESSTLEYASKPANILFIFSIDVSVVFIFHMIVRLVLDHNSLMKERAVNHTLEMQVMEYENLSARIAEVRRSRHDLRHHIAVLETIAESMDRQELLNYIDEFRVVHRLDDPLIYCENMTANAVIAYFSQVAVTQNTKYTVEFSLPDKVGISRNDISVLFGNLLENAIEAAVKLPEEKRLVEIKGGLINEGVLAFTVENTFLSAPKRRERRFNSTKHEGLGIGTESVRDIVERYDGKILFETNGDRFCASVMMYMKSSAEDETDDNEAEQNDQ